MDHTHEKTNRNRQLVSPYQIARDWFNSGKTQDVVYRFVSFWIVFNHLYNYGVADISDSDERTRVSNYCENQRHKEVLLKELDFKELDLSEFFNSPVIPGSREIGEIDLSEPLNFDDVKERIKAALIESERFAPQPNKKRRRVSPETKARYIAEDYQNLLSEDKEKQIMALFNEMYTVRCNLFHGMKTPNPSRDFNLVEESANVLERCLPALIEITFSE